MNNWVCLCTVQVFLLTKKSSAVEDLTILSAVLTLGQPTKLKEFSFHL